MGIFFPTATHISNIEENSEGDFINRDGMKMFWVTDMYPGGRSLSLNYLQNFSPSGKPFFLRVIKHMNTVGSQTSGIEPIRNEIIEAANQIKFRK